MKRRTLARSAGVGLTLAVVGGGAVLPHLGASPVGAQETNKPVGQAVGRAVGTNVSAAAVRAEQHRAFGNAQHMHSSANLSRSGQLDVVTRTWSRNDWVGFTGGVYILLRTGDGRVIGVTDLQWPLGVSSPTIFWEQNDRTDYWSHQFSPEVAAQTASLEIIQQIVPKNRASVAKVLDEIARLRKLISA